MGKKKYITWRHFILLLLLYLLIIIGGNLLAGLISLHSFSKLGVENLVTIRNSTILILNLLFFIIIIKAYKVKIYKIKGRSILKDLAIVSVIAIVFAFINTPLGYPFEYFNLLFKKVPNVHLPVITTSNILIINVLFTCLIAPACEEFFFRGILMKGLLSNYSTVKVIIFTSIAFSLMHFDQSLLSHFVYSILVSITFLSHNSLALAIYFHAIYNTLIIFQARYLWGRAGDFFFSPGYFVLVILGLAVIVIMLRLMSKRKSSIYVA